MDKIPARTLHLISLAVLAVAAVVIVLGWASIPDPMPVHYAGAQPSTTQDKSVWSAFFLPILGLIVLVVAARITPDVEASTAPRQVRGGAGIPVPYSRAMAERQRRQMSTTRQGLAWVALGFSVGVAYAGPVAVIPALAPASRLSLLVIVLATFLGLLAMLNLVLATRRAVRVHVDPDVEEIERAEALASDRTLRRFGMFYYNRLDPMPIVKARYQPDSMDFNFAHGPGRRFLWQLLAVFLVVAAIVVIPTFTAV